MYLSIRKEKLLEGEFIVIGDFAKNCGFLVQDAAEGFHWNNSLTIIHLFMIYHRFPELDNKDGKLESLSFVIFSDCLTHNTMAVHTFQRKLLAHLNSLFTISSVIYFSDGAASQCKNRKNLINLAFHEEDFGMAAEWHFFASHKKVHAMVKVDPSSN